MRAFGLNFEYLTRVGRIIERVVARFSAKSVLVRPSIFGGGSFGGWTVYEITRDFGIRRELGSREIASAIVFFARFLYATVKSNSSNGSRQRARRPEGPDPDSIHFRT